MKQLDSTELKRLHREWRRRTDGRLALLLDSVQTPFNVGVDHAHRRRLRVEHLWLAGATADARRHQDPARPRSAPSATSRGTVVRRRSTAAAAAAEAAGYRVVGVELADGAVPLHELDLAGRRLPGRRPRGPRPAPGHPRRLRRTSPSSPCSAAVGSLNVATAAAIAMYEVRRQQWTSGITAPAT